MCEFPSFHIYHTTRKHLMSTYTLCKSNVTLADEESQNMLNLGRLIKLKYHKV